jgi:aldehyde dehydrogenase (NAD+)
MATAAELQTRETVFIGGEWVEPSGADPLEVVNPTTEEAIATVPGCTPVEVDRAVEAARAAFEGWAQTPREERARLIGAVATNLEARLTSWRR